MELVYIDRKKGNYMKIEHWNEYFLKYISKQWLS